MLDIADFAGVRLGPGTLYGAISRLESEGLIEAIAPEGRRRPYRLTDRGRSAARGNASTAWRGPSAPAFGAWTVAS